MTDDGPDERPCIPDTPGRVLRTPAKCLANVGIRDRTEMEPLQAVTNPNLTGKATLAPSFLGQTGECVDELAAPGHGVAGSIRHDHTGTMRRDRAFDVSQAREIGIDGRLPRNRER